LPKRMGDLMMALWDQLFSRGDQEKPKKHNEIDTYVGGQYAATVTINDQQATEEMMRGMGLFQEMVGRVEHKLPHMRRGHLFEAIIAAKENASHAAQGLDDRFRITHLEGEHTAPADLRIYQNDLLLGEAQAKFSVQSPSKIVAMITDPNYEGMERYIPSNKIADVEREITRRIQENSDSEKLAQLKDALAHLKRHDITTIEVRCADRYPMEYAAKLEFDYAAREVAASGCQAAALATSIMTQGVNIP